MHVHGFCDFECLNQGIVISLPCVFRLMSVFASSRPHPSPPFARLPCDIIIPLQRDTFWDGVAVAAKQITMMSVGGGGETPQRRGYVQSAGTLLARLLLLHVRGACCVRV